MHRTIPLSRVIDLTDPDGQSHLQHDGRGSPRPGRQRDRPTPSRRIDGEFALVGQRGKSVFLARTIGRLLALLHRQVARRPDPHRRRPHRRHPQAARRTRPRRTSSIRRTRAWSRRITSCASSWSAAPTRIRPIRRFFTPDAQRPAGRPRTAIGARYIARGLQRDRPLARSRAAARTARRLLLRRHRQRRRVPAHLPRPLAARRQSRPGSRRSRWRSTAAGRTWSRPANSCAGSGWNCSSSRSRCVPADVRHRGRDPRHRGLQAARRAVRRHGAGPVPRHPAALPGVEVPARRRRRRREPQGLPDRGQPGADHPQRAQQPDAVSGRLGRAGDQALADLLRRPEPRLRADLRPARADRLRRAQPVRLPAVSSRSPRGFRSSS